MNQLKGWMTVLIVSAALSLVFFILGRLAMTDIFHGEPDLSLEWNIVSLTFLPVLLFHIIAIVAGIVVLRNTRRQTS